VPPDRRPAALGTPLDRAPWVGPPRPLPYAFLAGAVVLAATVGLLPRWSGLVHVVALPPLDQHADVRMLLVHSTTVVWFVLGVAVSVAVRLVVLAAAFGGLDRARLGLAARCYLTVLPFSALGAAVTFSSSASLFYLLFWAGVVVTLVVLVATTAAPWLAEGRLRSGYGRAVRHGFRLGTVGAYLAVVSLLGALADLGGEWTAVALVPVSAALSVGTARALVADPGWAWARRLLAGVPAAGLVALVAVVLAGPAGPPRAGAPTDARDGTLFLMSGVDSRSGRGAMLAIDPHVMGWRCEDTRYVSYAGPGDGQPRGVSLCPAVTGAPYVEGDTLRPTDELVRSLEAQVAEPDGGGVLLAHSQGVWISWLAAAEGRVPGLDALVLVGAFPDNPAAYRVEGSGPGRLGGPILDLVVRLGRPGGTSVFEPDSPLGLEWLAHPTAIRETLAMALPEDLRVLSVTSVFDHPLMPRGWRIEGAVDACPIAVAHPNLPYALELQETVARFLDGEALPPCPLWRRSVGPVFRPFAVPHRAD
jgi:hypothetical protein